MAIQYVGGKTVAIPGSLSTNTNISLTNLTGGLASSPSENDIVIVAYASASTYDVNLAVNTSGYTEVADLYANDTTDTNLSLNWKRMGSTPDATVEVNATTAQIFSGAVLIQVWRGVDTTTALDVTTTTATGTNTVIANAPSITPITSGAVVCVFGAGGGTQTTRTYSHSGLSNVLSISGENVTRMGFVGGGSFAWTSGTYDPDAFTLVGGADNVLYSCAAATLALRPASGGVTLTPARFDNGVTFYAATVTAGAVTLTPARYDDGDTFYAATVSQGGGAQDLTPARYDDGDVFYAATVTAGAVTLTPARYDDGDTFYAATVTAGAVTLSPARYDDGDTFYAATVTAGAVTLTPALFTDGDTFYAATITQGGGGTQTLTPTLYTNAQTFFAPTVTRGTVTLTPARYDNVNSFYTPELFISVRPPCYVNLNVFYSANLRRGIPAPNWTVVPGATNNAFTPAAGSPPAPVFTRVSGATNTDYSPS